MWEIPVVTAALDFLGNERNNAANAEQASNQMAFQERMSNTAHQREMADLEKAGLNPLLSARYAGSSTPVGAMATMTNSVGSAARVANDYYRSGLEGARNPSQIAQNESSAFKLRQSGYLDVEQQEVSRRTARKIGVEIDNIEASTAKVLYEVRHVLPSIEMLNKASSAERAEMATKIAFEVGKILPLDEAHRQLEVSKMRDMMEGIFQESEIDRTKWGVFWRYVGRISQAVLGGLFK